MYIVQNGNLKWERISCFQEPKNMYDMYAVVVKKKFSGHQLGIPYYFLLGRTLTKKKQLLATYLSTYEDLLGI